MTDPVPRPGHGRRAVLRLATVAALVAATSLPSAAAGAHPAAVHLAARPGAARPSVAHLVDAVAAARGTSGQRIAAARAVLHGAHLTAAGTPRQSPGGVDTTQPPTIELTVDTSGSMGDADSHGTAKIEGAKTAILNFLDGLPINTVIGMRTYPANTGGGCDNGSIAFPIEQRDPTTMAADVRALSPNGDTPTAETLQAAANDLKANGTTHAVVVLISDGLATCADPCPVAKSIAASGVDLEVISVGFAIDPEGAQELQCIADATHGVYIPVDNGTGLNTTLGQLTGPQLKVTLDYQSSVIADVGAGRQGLVPITAHINNTGQVDATDVVAWLRFTQNSLGKGASPGVGGPTQALGNLAAGATRDAGWAFRAGLLLAGANLSFEVVVSAANQPDDIVETGSISISDANTKQAAGPVFTTAKRVAILGDSFSAGEGAGSYLPGTDTDANSCHRSPKTYLKKTLGIPDSLLLACSGAHTYDITSGNAGNHVDAQTTQLNRAIKSGGRVDAVVMTLGGNDVGFSTVILACLNPRSSCDQKVNGEQADTWRDHMMAPLEENLIAAWTAVDATANDQADVISRGRVAPIIAPAYPRIVPGSDRPCGYQSKFFSQDELVWIDKFVTELNGHVEAAAAQARQNGIPVWFAPTTEDAFLPDHTLCDDPSYANGLQHIAGAAALFDLSVAALIHDVPEAAYELFLAAGRSKQQLFHPNPLGYAAMTRALLRWSDSADGKAAAQSHLRPPPVDLNVGSILGSTGANPVTTIGAGQLQPTVDPGSRITVDGSGFGPNTPVALTVHSRTAIVGAADADNSGRLRTQVVLPGSQLLAPGTHHLILDGYSATGRPIQQSLTFRVRGHGPPVVGASIAGGTILVLLLGLALLWIDRRSARKREGDHELRLQY